MIVKESNHLLNWLKKNDKKTLKFQIKINTSTNSKSNLPGQTETNRKK